MPKICKNEDNLFDLPKKSVVYKTGAVYVTIENIWVTPGNGKQSYTGHKRICIGVVQEDKNGNRTQRFFANQNYFRHFRKEELPEAHNKSDSLSIGPIFIVKNICKEYGLLEILLKIFDEKDAFLILDLSMYVLFSGSAVFQHFPIWARKFVTFSNLIRSDSYISIFLGETLTYSKIRLFCNEWARMYIGEGNVYFCYDSTNVNSQAKGIYIVQKGYAKDDKKLEQVNTDYIVRQDDGLPLTFMEFPGSVVDIAEAPKMMGLSSILCKSILPWTGHIS